ncbi:MAG TPA: serine/threonine-protein kinase, partial [Gemmatimonadaceae bacterium]|nr:serine/threonine-protein kinase [Gemmatimonadaceae bacterium]
MTDLLERLQVPLGDSYRLEREFEGGGMSRLFLAVDSASGRRVVVKLLPPELVSEVAAARFKREIEVTKHLVHPHILPILAAGAHDGLLFYVMPYLSGESLRDRIVNGGALPVPEAVRLLRQVADAVAYAHSHGVVHRDIKPENILLEGGQPVLADFGIARALEAAQAGAAAKGQGASNGGAAPDPSRRTLFEKLTATGVALGTPGYIAPEQLFG